MFSNYFVIGSVKAKSQFDCLQCKCSIMKTISIAMKFMNLEVILIYEAKGNNSFESIEHTNCPQMPQKTNDKQYDKCFDLNNMIKHSITLLGEKVMYPLEIVYTNGKLRNGNSANLVINSVEDTLIMTSDIAALKSLIAEVKLFVEPNNKFSSLSAKEINDTLRNRNEIIKC
ncbi:CLUMA_CG000360, isoform A [Clunio marinus]|uniref:CLUMA_CG000360, isoform A n=1 Tax=Clunio marinus TaxID=568069 RepID=A0A1J1HJ90_9DIPT|nr:CLUMA_CG000360, isoform A [Clunio marinus]